EASLRSNLKRPGPQQFLAQLQALWRVRRAICAAAPGLETCPIVDRRWLWSRKTRSGKIGREHVPGGSQQCRRCGGNRFSPQPCVVVGSHHPDHTATSPTIPARFTRGRVCGPPPFNYRIALEEESRRKLF